MPEYVRGVRPEFGAARRPSGIRPPLGVIFEQIMGFEISWSYPQAALQNRHGGGGARSLPTSAAPRSQPISMASSCESQQCVRICERKSPAGRVAEPAARTTLRQSDRRRMPSRGLATSRDPGSLAAGQWAGGCPRPICKAGHCNSLGSQNLPGSTGNHKAPRSRLAARSGNRTCRREKPRCHRISRCRDICEPGRLTRFSAITDLRCRKGPASRERPALRPAP